MAGRKSSHPVTVQLTQRAISDLREIEAYSAQQWGRSVADRYLHDIQSGLDRIRECPEILRSEQELSPGLYFYRIVKHWLVCDVYEASVVVLTVIHTSMDVPRRLGELEPGLLGEVALLRAATRSQR